MSPEAVGTPRVIAVASVTAGIALPEATGAVRFFSAQTAFDRLDGRIFADLADATRAAADLLGLVRDDELRPGARRQLHRSDDIRSPRTPAPSTSFPLPRQDL